MSRDSKLTLNSALREYRKKVDQSFELYLFSFFLFLEVATYSKEDEKRRKAKLLPTEEDKKFTAKLYRNALVQSLVQLSNFQSLVEKYQFQQIIDEDLIRQVYTEFAKTEDYINYSNTEELKENDHRQILLKLFKSCMNNENFLEKIEDIFPQWIDDKSLIIGAVKKSIKAMPASEDFLTPYKPNPEATVDFGETLLEKVNTDNQILLDIIEPNLKNWDSERVAIIDMILLKMALVEFLSFPSIPTKVTLNEFVEISKLYSTDKSKDFINGILDRLLKKLTKEGKITKKGRGLMD
ncbi:MAG: transcription antitermination factor NusB [Bacteroidota bacterium]